MYPFSANDGVNRPVGCSAFLRFCARVHRGGLRTECPRNRSAFLQNAAVNIQGTGAPVLVRFIKGVLSVSDCRPADLNQDSFWGRSDGGVTAGDRGRCEGELAGTDQGGPVGLRCVDGSRLSWGAGARNLNKPTSLPLQTEKRSPRTLQHTVCPPFCLPPVLAARVRRSERPGEPEWRYRKGPHSRVRSASNFHGVINTEHATRPGIANPVLVGTFTRSR